jgi:predicted nucleic acid-binding protein
VKLVALARVEVLRAVHGHGPAALEPRVLRSLDAIHLAAAQLFGGEMTAVVTYDRQMAVAGLIDPTVAAPGRSLGSPGSPAARGPP